MPQRVIQSYAESRDIRFLLHFTRIENLPSILIHGLHPMSRIGAIGINPINNDQLRLDGHLDATSLSISFPNYQMFYRYRKNTIGADWVILGIRSSILWSKSCAFCKHNAADARIRNQNIDFLKSPAAFASMFEEINDIPSRDLQKLHLSDPTDSQAEVLVFDIIEPQFIFGVEFSNADTLDSYKWMLGKRDARVSNPRQGFFASRPYARKNHHG
ncbi:DarT ssDNA thymidine ADP-ribosyltransferase family protein [Chromobacterium vaccinii]|uniref:DarT ssDNA thymidine ADP-ribosyltransferase family protein n=1 Tax=Chromobacterium vaccinii TaxID=1108595 RepID=UPI0032606E88